MSDAQPHRRTARRHLIALALTLFSVHAVLAARDTDVMPVEPDDGWAHMMDGLALLQDGSFQEKKEVAEMAFEWFRPLDFPPAAHRNDVGDVIDTLEQMIQLDANDWITSRLLDSLGLEDWDLLTWVFRQALDSPSINVRREAIQWYTDHDDPFALSALEEAWRDQLPPRVRADLITALAEQQASDRLEDFMDLARSREPAVAQAAIAALGTLGDPEAIPALTDLARHAPLKERLAALAALTSWPRDDEALQTLLVASHASDAATRTAAVGALMVFEDPGVTRRLVEIVGSHESEDLRAAALRSLEGRDGPEVVDALVEILRSAPVAPGSHLVELAVRLLHNIDDPSIVPDLATLDPAVSAPGSSVDKLIDYLSRDPDAEPAHWIFEVSVSDEGALDPADPGVLRVVPPSGWRTIRCWEAPGVPGDPSDYERLPGGTLVEISDYYDSPEALWVLLEESGVDRCWVPRSFLSDNADGPPPGYADPDDPFMREFDLPAYELRTVEAARLMKAGLLEELDPAEGVTGVRLAVDPGDPREVALLARSFTSSQSFLDAGIADLVRTLVSLFRGDRVLAPLLRSVLEHAGPHDDVR